MNYEEFRRQFNISLNEQQEKAVKTVDGAVLLLAVPGSGKTTVLVTRLGYMLYCLDIKPENILTMTYTVAATQDMKKRFASFFGNEYASRLEFRTINGVSAKIISYYERALSRKAFVLINDEAEISRLIRDIHNSITGTFAADGDIKAVRTLITYAKNMLLSDEELTEKDKDFPHFSSIYKEYNKVLLSRKLMDYDDQMVYACRILRSHPEILEHFRSIYSYICVDEAQDTSKIQHMIINMLAGERNNIFMVGDEDQSIYGFRAAYPQALLDFEKNYDGAKVLMLETNYRSTARIVKRADSFIKRNRHRRNKNMTTSNDTGSPVKIITAPCRTQQYDAVSEHIKDCKENLAILYRDNDSAIPLIDEFARNGIKYRCRGVDSFFFSHPVVRDILEIIHFAQNPDDCDAFYNIYYKFSSHINKQAALEAIKIARQENISPLTALSESSALPEWCAVNVQELVYHFNLLLRDNAFQALRRIIYYMGYGDYLDSRGADRSKTDILLAVSRNLESIKELPERLAELEGLINNGSDNDAELILSTIHSSKGLEYNNVLLIDVIDGLFPKRTEGNYADNDDYAIEEERRLFYVGVTRAKKELAIIKYSYPSQHSTFTSDFIKEEQIIQEKKQKPPSTDKFFKGVHVHHKKFGNGTIIERRKDILQIDFENDGIRYVDAVIAVKNGKLTL